MFFLEIWVSVSGLITSPKATNLTLEPSNYPIPCVLLSRLYYILYSTIYFETSSYACVEFIHQKNSTMYQVDKDSHTEVPIKECLGHSSMSYCRHHTILSCRTGALWAFYNPPWHVYWWTSSAHIHSVTLVRLYVHHLWYRRYRVTANSLFQRFLRSFHFHFHNVLWALDMSLFCR